MLSRFALGVGESSERSFSAGSPATRAISADGTPLQLRVVWSSPLSAMTRLAAASGSGPKVQTNRSGYWCRTGSVLASQFSLRSNTSSRPAVFLTSLYGPEENGLLSRSTPVSLSGGSGAVYGSDTANGRSQCGWANSKRSVFASGIVRPGGSEVLFALKSHLVSYCGVSASHSWMYVGPPVRSGSKERAMPYAISFEVIGRPSSNLTPSLILNSQVLQSLSTLVPGVSARSPTSVSWPLPSSFHVVRKRL